MKRLQILFGVLILLGLTTLAKVPTVFAAPPANFSENLIASAGLTGISGFDIAPDGRIFILQRTGEVYIYKNGQLLSQPFTVLPAVAAGDRGLIGVTFDPDFLTNHYVYFYYTSSVDLHNYLVRFDASTDTAQNGPVILYQTQDQSFQLHVGGTIRFGPDGKLYVSIGDNGTHENAQDLSNPHGKIIRLNKDGTIPTDNPFYGQPGKAWEIWAYGFRNPFRFTFDQKTGDLYVGDVGEATWEELDRVVKGGDYGWPDCEGVCQPSNPNYIDPIYEYNHNGGSAAIMAGPVYYGDMFPAEYQGAEFLGDYAQGTIKYVTFNSDGSVSGVHDFDTNAGSVVEIREDPRDGSLYYVTYAPAALYQITYSTGVKVPIVADSADNLSGPAPLTVHFSSLGTSDPNGLPLTYSWDFGDGTTSTDPNPTKIYSTEGRYTVELRVSNGTYTALANPIIIQVGNPPSVAINSPTDGSHYNAGDTINYSLSGVDEHNNAIPSNSLCLTVVFHHQTHIHPFLGPVCGSSGSFTIPTTGESSPVTWYELDATATDSNGLSSTAVSQIYPNESSLTFQTQPSGLNMLLDAQPTSTPETIKGVVGFQRELNAPALQQGSDGNWYTFDHWSDGGAQDHFITTQSTDTTYTAYFDLVPAFSAQYYNNSTLSGDPTITRQDPFIDFDWGDSGSPDPSINHDQFSARWTNTISFAPGTYTFTTSTDDGVRLYVDGNLVIDQWHDEPTTTYTASVPLTAGQHTIVMEYYQSFGGADAHLSWDVQQSSPTPTPTPSSSPTATPSPLPSVTPSSSPVPTVTPTPLPTQSATPTPTETPTPTPSPTATPTPSPTEQPTPSPSLTDQPTPVPSASPTPSPSATPAPTSSPTPEPSATPSPTPTPSATPVQTQMPSPTPQPTASPSPSPTPSENIYTAEYFANQTLSGNPTVTRQETRINYEWDTDSPDPSIPHDHFSARWTKQENFALAGNYQFTVRSDDGVRFWIDNQIVVDDWTDHSMTTDTPIVALSAGEHTFKIEYYQDTGGAVIIMDENGLTQASPTPTPSPTPSILPTPTPTATPQPTSTPTPVPSVSPTPSPTPPPNPGFTARFWNVPGTTVAPQIPTRPADVTRTDTDINFNWGYGSPDPTINTDHFVGQWVKLITTDQDTYRFITDSDDGMQVLIDGQPIIDQWNDHPETTYIAEKSLSAGVHTLVINYYDDTEDAVAKFSYEKASTPLPATFYTGQYFANQDLSGTPLLTRDDLAINFDWGMGSPDPILPVDHFSVRWTKLQDFTAGIYTFHIKADDGVRIFIDGNLVLDDWTDHAMRTYDFPVVLTDGVHSITMEYYEDTGDAVAMLSY